MTTESKTDRPATPVPVQESVFTSEGAPPPGRVGTETPTLPATSADGPSKKQPEDPAAEHGYTQGPDADPDDAVPAGTATAPVTRHVRITGTLELRQGDGSTYTAPLGPCTVQITALDATLSWSDSDSRGPAAMPLADFNRQLREGHIVYADEAPR